MSNQTKESTKLVFTGSVNMILDAQQRRGCVETKPTCLLVVCLGTALKYSIKENKYCVSEIPAALRGGQLTITIESDKNNQL